MPSASSSLPSDPRSVGGARRWVVARLRDWGVGSCEDDVRSVVSELASNAVLHARSAFTVTVTLEGRRLVLAVADGSPARPRLRPPGDGGSTTGRGLAIVAELSDAWGVEAGDPGKTVWCEFALNGTGAPG